jgi:hypothetical protein
MLDEVAEMMALLSISDVSENFLSRSSSSTSMSQGISTAVEWCDAPAERSPKRRLKPTRSGLQINRMIPELRMSPDDIQSIASEAAAVAPRRRKRQIKEPLTRLLSQSLLSWDDLPDYLRDNEYIIGAEAPMPCPGHFPCKSQNQLS